MEKPIKPGRVAALACLLALLVIVFVVALYKLQIVDGKAYYEENRNSVASSQTVEAARGSILDRYGRVLVSNTSCNNLIFNPDDLFEQDDPNGILLQMARTVAACGDTYVDELPVTAKPPFEYTDMNDTQRTQLKGFLKYAGLDEEATAVELMSYCREKFEINNNYSATDMRIIAGLRYSIKTRYIDKLYLPDYVFVQDASMELITSLKENNVPGFEVAVSYTRQYHTNLAAHLLGYTGLMTAEEYTTYKTQDYPMSATVGKDGAELAFEKYLHGTIRDLYDPAFLKGSREAVLLLKDKIKGQMPIRVIGDYDADGICSSYILKRGLEACGAVVDTMIPHRMKDGYGLNEHLVDEAYADGIDTILTCDNGIAAYAQIEQAKKYASGFCSALE